ncbi:hypothetical protein Dsin_020259 [Dipteronia sinensis]|uniref:PGG domain-containing protein n=1 Tax=Dipteronia sinensis TaxID=43782 RepID=A0AAE0AA34_9ROSI|nr:hypothetical protein Dsin_020259 [Dipteronia sinensis]
MKMLYLTVLAALYVRYRTDNSNAKTNEIDETVSKKRRATLYVAAVKGDLSKAEEIYKDYPDDVRATLAFSRSIQGFEKKFKRNTRHSDSSFGDTALHVAATAGRKEFVKKLVNNYLQVEDLEIKNYEGNTAFCLAAMTGNMELVLFMLEKNEKLAMIRNTDGKLPVQMAALLGHEDMVKNLYVTTKNELTEKDLIELLVIVIDNNLFDFALLMLIEYPKLAIFRAKAKRNIGEGETALHALARKPMTIFNDLDNSKQGILKRFYNRLWFKVDTTLEGTNKRMHPEALKLVEHLWENAVDNLDYYQIEDLVKKPFNFVSAAAKEGNSEFLSILISIYPALILKVNEDDGYSIFHTAVSYRHKDILKFIDEIRSMKDVIFAIKVGEERNNILHLAAMLPPDPDRLHVGVGAAFQMQRELWWFKEVSKLMPPSYAEDENEDGQTARALFSKEHESLMKEGEEWMKKTAESCMLVSTLIATVVFAAAITVPGGVKEDTGAPNFLKKAAFMIFAISDTISMVSSSCSILTFLSIFTARYAEDEFLRSLPNKLFWGVLTLFVSIIAMMVVFCATMFIIFYDGTIGPFVLAVALSSIPVFMFIYQQNHILSQVFRFMPSAHDSLFQEREKSKLQK